MPCRANQDGQAVVKIPDKTWSTVGGNGNPLQYPMRSVKRQKDMTSEDESLRSEGVQYASWEEWRAITITPERMKWQGQSRNDTQLWMCLVVKVISDAIKTTLHSNMQC